MTGITQRQSRFGMEKCKCTSGGHSTSFAGEIELVMHDEMLVSRATLPLNVQEGAAAKEKLSQPIVVVLD
jgi:hypothetical protein